MNSYLRRIAALEQQEVGPCERGCVKCCLARLNTGIAVACDRRPATLIELLTELNTTNPHDRLSEQA